MKTEVIDYVKKKITSEFEKCQWEDGVGKKFEAIKLPEMKESVDKMGNLMEEIEDFWKTSENLLASVKDE